MNALPDLITYQDPETLTPSEPGHDWCTSSAGPCDCDEPLWDETDEPDGPQGREWRDEATR